MSHLAGQLFLTPELQAAMCWLWQQGLVFLFESNGLVWNKPPIQHLEEAVSAVSTEHCIVWVGTMWARLHQLELLVYSLAELISTRYSG